MYKKKTRQNIWEKKDGNIYDYIKRSSIWLAGIPEGGRLREENNKKKLDKKMSKNISLKLFNLKECLYYPKNKWKEIYTKLKLSWLFRKSCIKRCSNSFQRGQIGLNTVYIKFHLDLVAEIMEAKW